MVQKRPRRVTAKTGHRNPETEVTIDKSQRSKAKPKISAKEDV